MLDGVINFNDPEAVKRFADECRDGHVMDVCATYKHDSKRIARTSIGRFILGQEPPVRPAPGRKWQPVKKSNQRQCKLTGTTCCNPNHWRWKQIKKNMPAKEREPKKVTVLVPSIITHWGYGHWEERYAD